MESGTDNFLGGHFPVPKKGAHNEFSRLKFRGLTIFVPPHASILFSLKAENQFSNEKVFYNSFHDMLGAKNAK